MPVTRRQHKIPPARNNPYAAPPGQEIGEYRQHMMNIFNLYAYITLPDKQDNNYKRPVHQPFCNRNIFYLMDKQEKKVSLIILVYSYQHNRCFHCKNYFRRKATPTILILPQFKLMNSLL